MVGAIPLDEVDQNRYFSAMAETRKKISAVFYKNDRGEMPVRDWLMELSPDDRKAIGEDIKTVEFGWPIGMPIARPLKNGLYEVRSTLGNGSQARVIFTIYKDKMVLLHGFIKKRQATPLNDMRTAKRRMAKFQEG